MPRIVTLTLNPAIDGSCEADRVRPTHKVRTFGDRYDPGGGGINVARVINRLGGDVTALYLGGGVTGGVLDSLLDRDGLKRSRIPIADHTRISHAVYERESGCEYRFVPEGPLVGEAEWQACLDRVDGLACEYLVASGSLPRGVPDDFYVRLSDIATARGMALILDTSGPELKAAIDHGGLLLVKPSLGEMEALVGASLRDETALAEAARAVLGQGGIRHLVISMGHDGALLANNEGMMRMRPPEVEVKSAVGAGDSFVAAMTFALSQGWTVEEAFRFGIAAGTATVMTPGTDLCHKEDIERLYRDLQRS